VFKAVAGENWGLAYSLVRSAQCTKCLVQSPDFLSLICNTVMENPSVKMIRTLRLLIIKLSKLKRLQDMSSIEEMCIFMATVLETCVAFNRKAFAAEKEKRELMKELSAVKSERDRLNKRLTEMSCEVKIEMDYEDNDDEVVLSAEE
jgi:hypothetical protein